MAAPWRQDYLKYQKQFLNILVLYKQNYDLKAFVEILLSVSALVVVFLFVIGPSVKTIITLVQQNDAKEQTIVQINTKIDQLKIATGVFEKQKDNVGLLKSAIPDNPDPASFERQVEGVATKNQTSIVSLSLGPAMLKGEDTNAKSNLEPATQAFPTTAFLSGSFPQLFAYLNDVKKMRRPLYVDTFNFTFQDKLLTLSINGQVPYLKTKL